MLESVLPMFFSRSFIVAGLMFRPNSQDMLPDKLMLNHLRGYTGLKWR